MPELPEVETVRRSLLPRLVGKRIEGVSIFYNGIIEYPSPSKFKEEIKGQVIRDIMRRGKWLMFVLDDYYLFSHLRMEGKFFFRDRNVDRSKHEHVIFDLGDVSFRYDDTRKFGKMLLIEKGDIYKRGPLTLLGLEPFDEGMDVNYLVEKFRGKRVPIKTVLLDQSIIAGIGNIYANEILFMSGINPLKSAGTLSLKEIGDIICNSRIILSKAIEEGGSTIRSYSSVDGVHGLFQNELSVHNRDGEKCPKCGCVIEKIVVGGRGTYYCPKCQG